MKSRLIAVLAFVAGVVPGLAPILTSVPAFAAGGAGAETPAAPSSRLELAMTLYAGGITMGTMDIDATIRGADYHAVANMRTSGVINAFWQAQIQATASGKVASTAFAPALYDSFDTGHAGKKQEVSLSFDAATPPRLFADPVYSTTGFDVKPDDTKNTMDPLSTVAFIISGFGAVGGNPCALTAPVFDGRRRYDIEMHKVRDMDIHMDNDLYQGKGVECEARYHQIAGFRPRVLKANENFPVIHAWFAVIPSAVTGHDYAVPVRVWADTHYGVMAVLATSLQLDGAAPKGVKP
jgi:hypothetical protein